MASLLSTGSSHSFQELHIGILIGIYLGKSNPDFFEIAIELFIVF